MAKLEITTHNGESHSLRVADDYELSKLDGGWVQVKGSDGTELSIHAGHIAFIVCYRGAAA